MLKFFFLNISLFLFSSTIIATDTIVLSNNTNFYNLNLSKKDSLDFNDSLITNLVIINQTNFEKWEFVCGYWEQVIIEYNNQHKVSGWGYNYNKHSFYYEKVAERSPTIPLILKKGKCTTLSIKLRNPVLRAYENNHSCAISKTRANKDIFTSKLALILSLIIGLLIISTYNFLLFFITKESSFIKYSVSQTLFAFLWLNAYGLSMYFFNLSLYSLLFLDSFLALAYIWSYIWFSREYLNKSLKEKKIDKLLKFIQDAIVVTVVIYIIILSYDKSYANYLGSIFVTKIIAPIGVVSLVISIFTVFKETGHLIRYFIGGTLVFIISIVITNLAALQLISENIIFENIILFGAIFEAILFSLGLAAKIKEIQKEKEETQDKFLSQLKENQIIKDAFSKGLEKQVLERTLELNQKNLEIEKALNEKESIIKEIHHRVKNNLQLMYSFMSLQTKRTNNSEIIAAISENKVRVRTLAMIHDNLSLNKNTELIDINSYLPKIVEHLATFSYRGEIKTSCNIDSLKLPLKKAVNIGLIVNEAFTNSLKYAKAESKQLITFKLTAKKNNNKLHLTLFDDGDKTKITSNRKNSLGELIIEDLVKQLKAEIKVDKYFKYEIIIPITNVLKIKQS